jgi:hypothetical protein
MYREWIAEKKQKEERRKRCRYIAESGSSAVGEGAGENAQALA